MNVCLTLSDKESPRELPSQAVLSDKWKWKFVKLLRSIETAGLQATGLIMVPSSNEDKVKTMKGNLPASTFLELETVQEGINQDLQAIVGHCRFPTGGDPKFNENNHPFTFGNTTIVHQGILSNHDELRKKYNLVSEGDTDSWVIVQLIEHYRNEGKSTIDAIAQVHSELKGSWGVILVDRLEPEKLYIFCHTKEFKVLYFPEEEVFMFSTDDKKLNVLSLDLGTHYGLFEEMRELRVSELKLKDEDCLVLGTEIELWKLPEPELTYYQKNRKFGDGWGKIDDELESMGYGAHNHQHITKTEGDKNKVVIPVKVNNNIKLIEIPKNKLVKV